MPAPPPLSALVTTPLFHVTANNCVAHAATLAGGKLVHLYKWDAGEALRLGLVSRVVKASKLADATSELAERFARGPTLAHGAAKAAVYESAHLPFESLLDLEAEALDRLHLLGPRQLGPGRVAEAQHPVQPLAPPCLAGQRQR